MTRALAVMDHQRSVTPITSPAMLRIVVLNESQYRRRSCHSAVDLVPSVHRMPTRWRSNLLKNMMNM